MPLWVLCCTNSTLYVWRECNPGCWLSTHTHRSIYLESCWLSLLSLFPGVLPANWELWEPSALNSPPQGLSYPLINISTSWSSPSEGHFHCTSADHVLLQEASVDDLSFVGPLTSCSRPLQDTLIATLWGRSRPLQDTLIATLWGRLRPLQDTSIATLWGRSRPLQDTSIATLWGRHKHA